MKRLMAVLFITLSLLLAAPVRASVVLPELVRWQARRMQAPDTQRASTLSDSDREALLAAQQVASPELEDLRAGELGDHDRQIIGITLLVIVALVIIL